MSPADPHAAVARFQPRPTSASGQTRSFGDVGFETSQPQSLHGHRTAREFQISRLGISSSGGIGFQRGILLLSAGNLQTFLQTNYAVRGRTGWYDEMARSVF